MVCTIIILGFYWIIFEILWYVSGRELISVVSALESYRSGTLSSLFPVFYSPSWWSQWSWGLEQYQTPGRFPPSLCYLHPLFILYTWQPTKQSCTIGLHSRHSQSLFFYFHPSIMVCASVSLSLSYSHLVHPSSFFLSLLLFSFLPALAFKNRSCWKPKSDGHLKAQLR